MQPVALQRVAVQKRGQLLVPGEYLRRARRSAVYGVLHAALVRLLLFELFRSLVRFGQVEFVDACVLRFHVSDRSDCGMEPQRGHFMAHRFDQGAGPNEAVVLGTVVDDQPAFPGFAQGKPRL